MGEHIGGNGSDPYSLRGHEREPLADASGSSGFRIRFEDGTYGIVLLMGIQDSSPRAAKEFRARLSELCIRNE